MGKILCRSLLLGPLIALPAFAWGGDELADLRARWTSTVTSLATFSSLQNRIVARDPQVVGDVLTASERAPEDAVQAEKDLMSLRARVAELQQILDERATGEVKPSPVPDESSATTPVAESHATAQASPNAQSPDAQSNGQALAAAQAVDTNKRAFETEGFVADRSRLGRACWRGGRFAEGVAALEPLAGDPQADYWRARCLERLARNKEAIELYRRVIEVAGESPEGRSAREDVEFLEWSIAHGLVTTP